MMMGSKAADKGSLGVFNKIDLMQQVKKMK